MKYELVSTGNRPAQTLIIFFAGWGIHPEAIKHLSIPQNHDLLVCFDTSELQLDFDFSPYQYLRLVAWSFGVYAAEQILAGLSFKSATAINGTPFPMNNLYGIPKELFKGTLDNLTEDSLKKFNLRMCGCRSHWKNYEELPKRSLEDLRNELHSVYVHEEIRDPEFSTETQIAWSHAIISTNDKIIPSKNQLNYWEKANVPYIVIGGAHHILCNLKHWETLWS